MTKKSNLDLPVVSERQYSKIRGDIENGLDFGDEDSSIRAIVAIKDEIFAGYRYSATQQTELANVLVPALRRSELLAWEAATFLCSHLLNEQVAELLAEKIFDKKLSFETRSQLFRGLAFGIKSGLAAPSARARAKNILLTPEMLVGIEYSAIEELRASVVAEG